MLSWLFSMTPTSLTVLATLTVLGGIWLYRKMLPTVLPGIPYNKAAAKSFLGDLPWMYTHKDGPMEWMVEQTEKSNYPMHQILQPFGQKPLIVLGDYREAQDICMRRPEFDRADGIAAFYQGVIPTFHINYKTGPIWKAHRRLLQDLMSPSFLNDVAAPEIYASVQTLIDLWKERTRMCGGRPFKAGEDIKLGAFDAILAFSFGQRFPSRALTTQLEHVQKQDGVQTQGDGITKDTPVEFDYIPNQTEAIQAMLNVTDMISETMSSPTGVLMWPFKLMKSSNKKKAMSRALFLKDQFVKAGERLEAGAEADDENEGVKAAVDMMVKREKQFAEKDGREKKYWSQTMHDEMLGFLLAGHDTTAATEQWALKFLTNRQDIQKKLRESLRSAHADAVAEGRNPTASEIAKTSIPYLDAFVEETLRMANSVFGVDRQASEDTTVLGQHVPKGTMLFIVNKGRSFTKPAFEIAESDRSETCRKAAQDKGLREWDVDDMGEFKPGRWLVDGEEDGKQEFNLTAGPTLPFGAGVRGCFGRRLAYLGLRLTLTMLVWNFDMKEVPKELSDYKAVDGLTHCPKNDYVRLEAI